MFICMKATIILSLLSKLLQESKSSSYQVPDLKVVKKLTAKLDAGKVRDTGTSPSPLTLDVSTNPTTLAPEAC